MTETRGFTDEQYRIALDHRTTIGQAQGVLMERFAIDARQAFQQLASASQESNTKVFAVAKELVESRVWNFLAREQKADSSAGS
jgi:AmiR/NasT family two-component response regulator